MKNKSRLFVTHSTLTEKKRNEKTKQYIHDRVAPTHEMNKQTTIKVKTFEKVCMTTAQAVLTCTPHFVLYSFFSSFFFFIFSVALCTFFQSLAKKTKTMNNRQQSSTIHITLLKFTLRCNYCKPLLTPSIRTAQSNTFFFICFFVVFDPSHVHIHYILFESILRVHSKALKTMTK